MKESEELQAMLRGMAWERAKGELQSVRCTYHGPTGKLDKFDELYKKFISEVEDNGIVE